jgi:hypothetical protein
MNMSETITPIQAPNVVALPSGKIGMADILFDPDRFNQAQRVARMLVHSPLIPDHVRGKTTEEGIGNIIMALAMAQEMGESPVAVMQAIYFVKGKAGWRTDYMIARAAKAGVFAGPIRWKTTGSGKDLAVTAYATLKGDTDPVSVTIDLKMAEAEGWGRDSGKYKTMPEHMLCWRSATWLIRKYAPQVMLGYQTADELEDIEAAGPPPVVERPKFKAASSTAALLDALDVKGEAVAEREPGQEA